MHSLAVAFVLTLAVPSMIDDLVTHARAQPSTFIDTLRWDWPSSPPTSDDVGCASATPIRACAATSSARWRRR